MNRFYSVLLLILLFSGTSFSQGTGTILMGKVTGSDGEALPGITMVLKGTGLGTATDAQGRYEMKDVAPGSYTLSVSGIGYESQVLPITVDKGKSLMVNVRMKESVQEMGEVVITGQSEAQMKMEEGFSVQIIETEAQKNLTADINQVIRRTPGINLRESGGLGSGFSLSLNGLSGNQVRYFIDGMPMENFGSALSLNNYPVNLIEKIEVYKGAVPIEYGADALGGAINIVTGRQRESFLDASYSYGSFNTHRASMNARYVHPEKRYTVKLSSFHNHSDNNYWMENVPLTDKNGNIIDKNYRTRRFHDQYSSSMIAVEGGIFDRKAADDWKVNLTYALNSKNYQHPDFNIKKVFGKFQTENRTLLASSVYQKRLDRLKIRAYFLYGAVEESVVDTSAYRYNWAGESIYRLSIDPDDPKGELRRRRSLFVLSDHILRSQFHSEYFLASGHSLHLNLSQSYLKRSGKDKVDKWNRSFLNPNFIHKNILGLSYKYSSLNERLQASLFGKEYGYKGTIISQDYDDNDVETKVSLSNTGYGATFSYKIPRFGGVKTSFERAYRIPEPNEILGSGLYILPNPALEPEKSYNANIGGWFDKQSGQLSFHTEWNFFFRESEDFISPARPAGPFGIYENLDKVRTQGVEGGLRITHGDFLMCSFNATYQDIIDLTDKDEGLSNINHKGRVPNTPYFFYNGRIGIQPFRGLEDKKVAFYGTVRYVHEFFLKQEKLGNRRDKNIIPDQLTFDATAEYSMADGRYNLSLTSTNLTDALVYDNFLIQKPGRAFYVKLRYFLN